MVGSTKQRDVQGKHEGYGSLLTLIDSLIMWGGIVIESGTVCFSTCVMVQH